ncbi:hypothetical protein ACFOY4_39985 [Actinomadura syzygii]|uniref:Uncharacterized protein n=1 Tax=Actinomadura syzygii TaxID=1427538 RepID=A0A5D0U8V9_9ACTN|nr:hypothetical protein [Actinomadura syzygii]TYC14537.1 hypothetical protein FXF65_16970 [Actinomadura syzygii]
MNGAPPDVTGAWIHAFEEDTEEAAVYRPADHPFRPARRPRRRIEFHADGTFAEYRPGPDDRPREVRGRWERHGPDRIAVAFPAGRGAPYGITVLSRTADRLVIAKPAG